MKNQGSDLAEQGIYLLDDQFRLREGNDIGGWPLWLVEKAKNEPATFLRDALVAALDQAPVDNVRKLVLSAENLSDPDTAAVLDGVLEEFEPTLVYYMRRQDHFLVSSWRQWSMKRGISLEEHVARRIAERRPAFSKTLALWEARIGKRRIHARFVDSRFLEGGNIISDIGKALNIAVPAGGSLIRENESPDRAILLYLQRHPELFRDVHDDFAVARMVACDSGPIERLVLSKHLQRTVKLAYEDDNQYLLQEYARSSDIGLPVILDDGPLEPLPAAMTDRDRLRLDAILARMLENASGEIGVSEEPSA